MMQLGIGFDQARDIIALGSRDTVAGMQKINELYMRMGADKRAGVQRALADLSGALGEGAAGLSYLAQNTTKGTAALKEMVEITVKGDGALKQFGKDAFSSGLTLQETYDRAKESFDTTIRSIARADVRGIVKKQIAGMREAGQEIKELGSDKTWGPFVNALSQFKQMGVGGIFASLAEYTGVGAKNSAKFGAKVGLIFDTVSQLGSEMAPIMQMLGMTGPLGPLLAAGGIGALLMMDDSTARDILGPLYDTFNGLRKKVIGLWDEFSPKFLDVWNNDIKPKIVGFWTEDIKPAISSFWNDTFIPFLKKSVPKIGGAIWDAIKWAWDQLGESAGVTGQAGVIGGAVVAGLGPGMLSVGAQAGGEFLRAIANNPIAAGAVGLVGLAAVAGYKMAEAVMGSQATKNAIAEAGVIASGGGGKAELYKFAFESKPQEMEKQLTGLKLALKEEKASWFPDSDDISKLEKAISILSKAKNELALENTGQNVEAYGAGGQTTATEFINGITSGLEAGMSSVEEGVSAIGSFMSAYSPIQDGPLAGEGESNAAYRGGYYTMEQFAAGVTDSVGMVREAVGMALDEAVIGSFEEYAVKMEELASRKSILLEVAKGMVRDMGVKIETADSDANVDVKKSFETAMSLPGLASVTMAIINENAKTRKMLGMIHTELATQTSVMNGSTPPAVAGGKGAPVV